MSAPKDNEPPARIPRLGWAIAFLVAVTVIAWVYIQFSEGMMSRVAASHLEKYVRVPEFKLTAQDGTTVTNADLKGKVWVANFIFTRCQGPCPVMTSHMAELNQTLGEKAAGVELVSITVDPEYDTPEVLRKYAEDAGAQPDRWKFLTGPKEQIETLITKGFLQALGREPSGMPMHSTYFVVVDRDGWIRSFQQGNDPELVQKLLMDIHDLLREPSPAKQN